MDRKKQLREENEEIRSMTKMIKEQEQREKRSQAAKKNSTITKRAPAAAVLMTSEHGSVQHVNSMSEASSIGVRGRSTGEWNSNAP